VLWAAPVAISVLVPVIVLLAMALPVALEANRREPVPLTIASRAAVEVVEAFVPLEIEVANEPAVEHAVAQPVVDPGEVTIGDVGGGDLTGSVAAVSGGDLDGVVGLEGLDLGSGTRSGDDELGGQAGATFVGATSKGEAVVFVVDNSNGMTQGRFETAMQELLKSVGALGPRQRFSMICFSKTVHDLFHPQTTTGMVPATPATKDRLAAWLSTVAMCLQTRGEEALRKAIALQPALIKVLGDGVLTDGAVPLVTAPHSRRTVINIFGMQVNRKGEEQLTAIARANGGRFDRGDVDPAAERVVRGRPVPRNRTRGPVWGLALPPGK